MSSIIDTLNRPWQLLNLATGERVTVLGCSAESALINLVIEREPWDYMDRNPLHVGERTTAIGDWCALTRSPILSDIFNA